MKSLRKLIREPFLLFFIIGPLLYVLYIWASAYIEQKSSQIHVSQTQIAILEESFRKAWNRPPSGTEFNALIDNYVMDEIFFKEAVAMGLDKTDPAVKLRLRQILEMMMEDYTAIYATEGQLRTYLSENAEKFRKDSRISFRHVYFPPEDKEKAIQFLKELRQGIAIDREYANRLISLPDRFDNETEWEIKRLFGDPFTQELLELEGGEWLGPVASPYGWHLVNVSERIEGMVPDLNEIWDLVEREWSVERKKELKDEQYKLMRDQYKIIVEELP